MPSLFHVISLKFVFFLVQDHSGPVPGDKLTALFNNTRSLKFKAQPTNALFATVNQMFGGSSQLPTTAERAAIKSNRRAQFRQHSRKLGGAAEHLIDGSKKRICRLSFEF